ncbi:DUF4349 domain-containing protein [Isoptericola sp. b441]|uniref:DUF4349 domain-containing protein n=1 Tax=Actinotalea lenta TaxID=3064654 RepID=A0ABT9DDM5_9CELL|nr:DUF4349 domain-containing protein [Isoptericola sp. b441]MDO8107097.1 DUF4349 domain-containing protein [Isoptericola sp. b441]
MGRLGERRRGERLACGRRRGARETRRYRGHERRTARPGSRRRSADDRDGLRHRRRRRPDREGVPRGHGRGEARGYVSARDQQSAGEGRKPYAQITVRVPATRLSEVLDDLSTLGTVEESRLESVEVTAQARDLDARIAATKISIARLQGLLERSATLSDIVEAEQVLTDRQTQLEQLQSQRSALADQVAMSTLTVNLYTDAAVPDEPPSGFLSGLAAGWKALVAFGTGALSVTGVLLPWLAVLGVLILALWPAVRRARRRRAARAAQRAVAAPTGPHPDLGARPAPGAPGPDDGSSGPLPER